jgi:hypothetical protein
MNFSRHVYIYSTSNPATYYKGGVYTEPNVDIISIERVTNVTFEGLNLAYTGKHGIQGATTNGIIIRKTNFSYIGGSKGFGRWGNAIQFWNNARNILVENCTIHHIYDAGITPQGTSGDQTNITFRYNTIYNMEYGIEVFLSNGVLSHLNMHHNTIYLPDTQIYNRSSSYQMGFRMHDSTVNSHDINITDNIIYKAAYADVELGGGLSRLWNGTIYANNNLYTKGTGSKIIYWKNANYATLALFKAANGNESQGVESDPLFISTDSSNANFLKPNYGSPSCLMSTTGSFVGAIPCATTPTNYRYISYENFTVTTANGGTFQFNYNGLKNLTLNVSINRVRVHNGSTISEINISSSDRNVLLGNPRSCVVPSRNGIRNGTYCMGKFYINNTFILLTKSGTKAKPLYFTGNNTVVIGKGITNSRAIYTASTYNNIIISGFNLTGFYNAVNIWAPENITIINMTFNNSPQYSIGFSGNKNLKVIDCKFYCNKLSSYGLFLTAGRNLTLLNSRFYNCNESIRMFGNNFTTIRNNLFNNTKTTL